ncbi:MAG: outer membrane beta-barrel protein [Thermoanaerobaculia bacterium]
MKRVAMVLGMSLVVAVPSFAGGIGIFGAWWDSDEVDEDVGLGLELDIPVSPRVDLQLRGAHYDQLEADMNGFPVVVEAAPLDLGVAWHFLTPPSRVRPRLQGGLTYFVLSSDIRDVGVESGRIKDELGYYGGAGLDVRLAGYWAVYGDALYRSGKAEIQGEGLHGFSFRDLDLSGVSLHLGIKLLW